MRVLGIDPGADGAMALVSVLGLPARWQGLSRPLLLGSWPIYGSMVATWRARADAALAAVSEAPDLIAIETPGGGGRSHRGTRGHGAMLGLGRNTGRIEALCWARWSGVPVVDVDSGSWPAALSLPVGKRDTGWHRVVEARTLLQVGTDWPREAPRGGPAALVHRQVARAEAALIALAAALRAARAAP